MSLETMATTIRDRVKADHGLEIDWEAILDMLIDVLSGCFESEGQFTQSARNPTRLQESALRVRARRVMGLRPRQARAFAECCCRCCEDCEDKVLCACYCEANELMHRTGGGCGDLPAGTAA